MGAWGSGSFENDAALDWAGSVESVGDVREPFDRLKSLGDGFVDADLASEVVAAAEAVAMLMGHRIGGFPEELAETLAGAEKPDANLYHQARAAVLQVTRNSELADLWAEAAVDGVNEWQAEITRLIERLNPDIEATPWEPEEIEQKVGQVRQTCAFCDQPVEPDELFLMMLSDASNKPSFDRGKWLHLTCLNARLHRHHLIGNLKFDPTNMPDLDDS